MAINKVKDALLSILAESDEGRIKLNEYLRTLPDGMQGEVLADINKYKPDIDLTTLLQSSEIGRSRYIIRDASYFLSDRPKVGYIVDNLVAEGSVNLWFGQWGSKKTWSAIDLAVCVASGKDWLGMAVKQNNVLIIDEESGDSRLADRIKLTLNGELADEKTPIKSVSLAQFNLLKQPSDSDELVALIAETSARLVIIDALADIMLGGDENAVKDTQPVFACLRKIAEVTNTAIIVIHHANKLGGYRGSSAIAGAIDTMLLIESKQDSDIITFKTEKMRDGKPMNFAGQANWTESGFYLTQSDATTKVFLSKAQQYALDYFTEKGDATLKQLTDFSNDLYANDTLKKAIQYLVNQKLLARKDDGGRRVEATYGISKGNG